MTIATNDSGARALRPADLVQLVVGVVAEHGELGSDEIVRLVQEDVPEAGSAAISRAIIRLDRQGMLTRSNSEAGWQVTANGRDALDAFSVKRIAAYIAPYTRFETVRASYYLLTPALGPKTGPGGAGKSHWPRLPDGRIVFWGGWIRASLAKALLRCDGIVSVDLNNQPKKIPEVAWEHVVVKPTFFPADQHLEDATRRPTNIRNMAVGEIIHEGLPPGTILNIEGIFPLSHFPEPILLRMFQLAGDVGISPAGSGKGGIWGVGELLSLEVGGRVLFGAANSLVESTNGHAVLS